MTIGRRLLKIPPGVWIFAPEQFKTKKRGKVAVYVLGPKAQAVLSPWFEGEKPGRLFWHRKGIEFDRFQGHSGIDSTLVYLQRKIANVAAVALEIG